MTPQTKKLADAAYDLGIAARNQGLSELGGILLGISACLTTGQDEATLCKALARHAADFDRRQGLPPQDNPGPYVPGFGYITGSHQLPRKPWPRPTPEAP